MEVDEAQTQAYKFSKLSNGKLESSHTTNTTAIGGASSSNNVLGMGEVGGGGNRLQEWEHSSRIIRVSRASGGKDRHSKVWTAKGPRDRRVRLSVATAIQFYDLQDRLGFDQPSKAVEWLIKAASDAISELPSLNSSFPETPRQQSDEKNALVGGNDEQGFDSSAELEMEMDRDPGFVHTQQQEQQQHGSNLSKSSACSSTSETSKGSGGLSFSRNEVRVKARERARERAKEKDINQPEPTTQQQQHVQSSSSFTQLLTSGIGNMNNPGVSSSPSMNYFSNAGLMGSSSSTRGQAIQLGNSSLHQAMMAVPPFSIGGDQHQHHNEHHQHEHQHFPFVPDHHLILPAQTTAPGSSNDQYNLNFSISSSAINAFNNNRGTLQSNSLPSLLPHFQRYLSSPMDGCTLPFFLGAAVDNQHHHQQHQNHHHNAAQFPPGLHLCYGNNGGGGLSDQKGKGKT